MSDPPLISVVMPAFNVERYVSVAVDSVLTQTAADFEFIIVDDGSTDGTLEILQRYAGRDPRIRIIQGESNLGVTKALNKGIAAARAPFIARMDADDICVPERFELQVRFLQEHPDHAGVGCRCILIDPDGRPICEKREIELTHDRIDRQLMSMKWPLVHPAVMMRADSIARIGGYDETYRTNQDHDLFLRLGEVGKLANIPEVLFYYRQHFSSVVFTNVEAQIRTVLDITTAAHQRRGIPVPAALHSRTPHVLRLIEHHRNWTWWALAAGNRATARRHALAVMRSAPLSLTSWWTMFCVLRGY